jgi:hypothetical protein
MRKTEELIGPSCFTKALDVEMLFTLLGRDEVAPDAIEFWAERRVQKGLNMPSDPQIREAYECAKVMRSERESLREVIRSINRFKESAVGQR